MYTCLISECVRHCVQSGVLQCIACEITQYDDGVCVLVTITPLSVIRFEESRFHAKDRFVKVLQCAPDECSWEGK